MKKNQFTPFCHLTKIFDYKLIQIRCNKDYDCPEPNCGKLILSIKLNINEELPDNLRLIRECPRRKSIHLCFNINKNSFLNSNTK